MFGKGFIYLGTCQGFREGTVVSGVKEIMFLDYILRWAISGISALGNFCLGIRENCLSWEWMFVKAKQYLVSVKCGRRVS
jgi:hypothetical protein